MTIRERIIGWLGGDQALADRLVAVKAERDTAIAQLNAETDEHARLRATARQRQGRIDEATELLLLLRFNPPVVPGTNA